MSLNEYWDTEDAGKQRAERVTVDHAINRLHDKRIDCVKNDQDWREQERKKQDKAYT